MGWVNVSNANEFHGAMEPIPVQKDIDEHYTCSTLIHRE